MLTYVNLNDNYKQVWPIKDVAIFSLVGFTVGIFLLVLVYKLFELETIELLLLVIWPLSPSVFFIILGLVKEDRSISAFSFNIIHKRLESTKHDATLLEFSNDY